MTERFRESLTEAIREGKSGQPVFVVIRQVGESVIGVTLTSEMAALGYAYQTHVSTENLSRAMIERYKELFSPATFSECDNVNGPALCAVHILPDEIDVLSAGNKEEIFGVLKGFAEEHAKVLEDLESN
ncbi:hypothetical protein A2696_02670 [Candidatus Curtissbacteria bacterium RIFCSPHIGHO2_01_FULL_41_13]|uniref:Uncharacterized protein n=1 Tax=Candidatus Curtissbacteria bacterium RIFCSPHIGHO2_01_FULL_41_13 TaxID=1797745 RepID=A0A1F5G2J0_9BACT|nr:MAG: hypothetical protein A2696_02670 [Candidatus Curtissbacteria bacterium RIFCSPHIGHO2_01_FULL_41_13]